MAAVRKPLSQKPCPRISQVGVRARVRDTSVAAASNAPLHEPGGQLDPRRDNDASIGPKLCGRRGLRVVVIDGHHGSFGVPKQACRSGQPPKAREGIGDMGIRAHVLHRGDTQLGFGFDGHVHVHLSSGKVELWHRRGRGLNVHARRRSELGLPGARTTRCTCLCAKRRRRRAIGLVKRPGEGLVRLVACVEGNARDGKPRRQKLPRRALEAQAPVHLDRRFAQHASEHAVKVERRQCARSGERRHVQRVVETVADGIHRPLHRRLVEGPRLLLHEKRSYRRSR